MVLKYLRKEDNNEAKDKRDAAPGRSGAGRGTGGSRGHGLFPGTSWKAAWRADHRGRYRMSADDSRSLGAQSGGGKIMKTIVMVNADRKNMIAELPLGRSISSGDLPYVSKGKRLSAESFEATAISDSISVSDEAAEWMISNINRSVGKHYVKAVNRTETIFW